MRRAVNAALAKVFAWSLNACMAGTHPALDPFGKPFAHGSLLQKLAGKAFTTSWRLLSPHHVAFCVSASWFESVASCNMIHVALNSRACYLGFKNDGKARVEVNEFSRGYSATLNCSGITKPLLLSGQPKAFSIHARLFVQRGQQLYKDL